MFAFNELQTRQSASWTTNTNDRELGGTILHGCVDVCVLQGASGITFSTKQLNFLFEKLKEFTLNYVFVTL
jgi:hypothetical protein